MPEAMNDRPTPECDAATYQDRSGKDVVLAHVARSLERQRNAALARVEALRPYLQHKEGCPDMQYGEDEPTL